MSMPGSPGRVTGKLVSDKFAPVPLQVGDAGKTSTYRKLNMMNKKYHEPVQNDEISFISSQIPANSTPP